jgi:hypothetical protein
MNPDITYFARTDFRNKGQLFGIRQKDRLLHMYIVGKTGTGKSTMMRTMLMQDIEHGRGACLLDPHGDLAEGIYRSVPEDVREEIMYFTVPDPTLTLRYNPFKRVTPEKRSLVASSIIEVFKKLWADAWGVKLEHILRHSVLTLLDQPSAIDRGHTEAFVGFGLPTGGYVQCGKYERKSLLEARVPQLRPL